MFKVKRPRVGGWMSKRILPMLEVRVDHTVGESFTTNTDTFKYTVTCQLVHNQVRIDNTWKKTTKK